MEESVLYLILSYILLYVLLLYLSPHLRHLQFKLLTGDRGRMSHQNGIGALGPRVVQKF